MGKTGPKPRREEVRWSALTAYAIGLMTADGNLSPDGRHLTFVSKDKELVEHIKLGLEVTANASRKALPGNKKLYYRLQWGDIFLYNYLLEIGLMPNKSLRLASLQIPNKYFLDFLRGCFDGDGCFYSYYDPRWKNSFMFYMDYVSGSHAFILWVQGRVEALLGLQGHITSAKSGNFFHLKYAKKESLVLLKALYEKPDVVCLARKRLKIEKALRIVGLSL